MIVPDTPDIFAGDIAMSNSTPLADNRRYEQACDQAIAMFKKFEAAAARFKEIDAFVKSRPSTWLS